MLVAVAPYTRFSWFLYRAVQATGTRPNPWQMAVLCMAVQLVLLLGIVTLWEERPLASLGAVALRRSELLWGIIGFVIIRTGDFVWGSAMIPPSFEHSAQHELAVAVTQSSVWRVIFAISASLFEECFFRGYTIERVAEITGSLWFGAILGTVVDLYIHAVSWGASMVVYYAFSEFCLATLYIWRRNLPLALLLIF